MKIWDNLKLILKFKPYAVPISEFHWSFKLVIFTAACAAEYLLCLKLIHILIMSGFCLCPFLWDATLEERQSFNPCINDLGVLLPKDYHFYPFCTSTFDPFTCTHPIAKFPQHRTPPSHTDAQLIFKSGTSCRSTHVQLKSGNVCAPCMSWFVCHDQRCWRRRDRNDNPFVSNFLIIYSWIGALPQLKRSTLGAEGEVERERRVAAEDKEQRC